MLRALEEADARGKPYDLSSLLLMISSGVMWSEPVKRALIERHPMIAYDSLGSSEGVGFANAITTTDSKGETAKFGIGPDTKVFTDDGREVKPGSGEVGHLAVGGYIPLGYYQDPDKTDSTFRVVDGRRYSIPGDYATVEDDGTITLLGRGSVSINSGGEKIFPEEVEQAVKQHPAVADTVVVGVPDERFGEAVTAVIAPVPGQTPDEDEIGEAVERSGLARFKRPRHVVLVEAVPRGPNGKADYAWARDTARARLGA
jgi:3-oxocholest-4-en-26-oate---CoA ligase